jgi:hypothetical protein
VKAFVERTTGKSSGGTPYIFVAHNADGPKVTDHPTKKAAHEHAGSLRAKGVLAYAHPKSVADKYGLDPRTSGGRGGGGDQPRDEQGRFASK